jgi:hypothetical protein
MKQDQQDETRQDSTRQEKPRELKPKSDFESVVNSKEDKARKDKVSSHPGMYLRERTPECVYVLV